MKAWHIDNSNKLKMEEGTLTPREGELKVKISKVALSSMDMTCFANRDDEQVTIARSSA